MKIENFLEVNDFKNPSNIRFGSGSLQTVKTVLDDFGVKKVLIISDKGIEKTGLVDRLRALIKTDFREIQSFTEIEGEPTFKLLNSLHDVVKDSVFEAIIGIGGGSSLDVAKAIAALADKENIAQYLSGEKVIESRTIKSILIPTTSGTGAEVTMNAIFEDEEQQVKRGIISSCLLPDIAIIDPDLTLTCPPRVTAASGIDAFTHAIESFLAKKATVLTKMYSEKAMQLFPKNIVKAVHDGQNKLARENMSWVSLLAGVSLANAGVGAIHALAYPLGGYYHIEHGVANALLLPYVLKEIGKANVDELLKVTEIMDIKDDNINTSNVVEYFVEYLFKLLKDLNLPSNLKDLNVKESDLQMMASAASQIHRLLDNTPYKLNEQTIHKIYEDAYSGNIK
ncbi:iron-containing alcohol dehydrogenase [Lysinibacillus endophyticus]|uniref:iron-containing alcohol dehydrogenase n=1 Tax=Ureibacillus endophyticus TaxID=1978490 RepID=UPI00209F15A6|nr:iron-containing alcohol dehydrogenase [Lysinibacillus endophyticus]MCP1146783.1 iron-containing alcohol dehydrogenase [Lysinibacillus endophyticus]